MNNKIIIYIMLLLFAPIVVWAEPRECNGSYESDGYCDIGYRVLDYNVVNDPSGWDITQRVYSVPGISGPTFCIDAENQSPIYVDRGTSININGSRLHKAIAAIYRIYLLDGATPTLQTLANDAMRLYIRNSGSQLGGGYTELGSSFANVGNTLTNNSLSGDQRELQKMYCAALYVTGNANSVCQSVLSDVDKDLLMANDFSFKLTLDTSVLPTTYDSSKQYSQKLTFKISGTGYNNMLALFNKYPSQKNMSYIKVDRCDIDGASRALGFTCKLVGDSNNLLNGSGTQDIVIENNNLITKDTVVNATISYTYHVPYDTSALMMVKCSGNSGVCRGWYENPTQRFIIMDKDKTLTSTITASATVPSACEYEVRDKTPIYKLNGKEVTELEYLKAGCCDLNPNLLKQEDAIMEYKNYCMEEDLVFFQNECGTKDVLGKSVNTIAGTDGNTVVTTTCENVMSGGDNYVGYTESKIWQIPLTKVMDRLNRMESGAYSNNLAGIYDNKSIANNTDKSYLTSSVTGKDNTTLSAISNENNYCMLFTSEENRLYFPGTAVATSGRFFVFNELDNEECKNSINPSPNCFRQPYIIGQINTMMHTNFNKWNNDYTAAIEEEVNTYNSWQSSGNDSDKALYEKAKNYRETLEKYKTECEERNNIKNYWTYNLSPTLDFNYKQKVYGGTQRTDEIKELVPMEVSHEAVKYWPKVSTEAKVIEGSEKGTRNDKSYNIRYGNVNLTKTFDSTENYSVGYEETIYYKPKQVTYATLPSGKYIVAEEKYQTGPIYMMENGLKIGYVYNVRLTTYEGAYSTWFVIDNVGHLGLNNSSNIQKTLEKYKNDNDLEELSSECVYCNQEGEFKRQCDVCPDDYDLSPSYVYRTISLSDVTPNNRVNSNWADPKGTSAEARIQSLSGENVLSNIDDNKKVKVSVLNDIEINNKTEKLAQGNIYDDSTREYLEYEFNLTSKDMQMIKKNTESNDFDFDTLVACGTGGKVTNKSVDAKYCYVCNEDGKECESSFVDAFAEKSTTAITRKEKWKYYIDGKWEFGNWTSIVKNYKTLEGFEDGKYPDPLNPDAYLKKYYNWP